MAAIEDEEDSAEVAEVEAIEGEVEAEVRTCPRIIVCMAQKINMLQVDSEIVAEAHLEADEELHGAGAHLEAVEAAGQVREADRGSLLYVRWRRCCSK